MVRNTKRHVYNHGAPAGYKGDAGECVARGVRESIIERRLSELAWAREAWSGRYPRQKCSPKWLYL
jgi:hypothetical protein